MIERERLDMYLEIDEVRCESIDRIEFDDVAMEIVVTDEKVYERIKRWLKCNEIDYDCRREQYFANLVEFVIRITWI